MSNRTRYIIKNCAVCNYPLGEDWQPEKSCPYCHTRYDLENRKIDKSKTIIMPVDCRHHNSLFVKGSRDLGLHGSGSHTVTICPDCGQFHVFGYRDGVSFDVTFSLPTDELVTAAGKWYKLLEASEQGDFRLADRRALFGDWMRRD